MTKNLILVQKFNMEEDDLEIVTSFHKLTKESLPNNIRAIVIPNTWEFTQVDNRTVHIKLDTALDLETCSELVGGVSEDLGEDYVVLVGICKIDVIDEEF